MVNFEKDEQERRLFDKDVGTDTHPSYDDECQANKDREENFQPFI